MIFTPVTGRRPTYARPGFSTEVWQTAAKVSFQVWEKSKKPLDRTRTERYGSGWSAACIRPRTLPHFHAAENTEFPGNLDETNSRINVQESFSWYFRLIFLPRYWQEKWQLSPPKCKYSKWKRTLMTILLSVGWSMWSGIFCCFISFMNYMLSGPRHCPIVSDNVTQNTDCCRGNGFQVTHYHLGEEEREIDPVYV